MEAIFAIIGMVGFVIGMIIYDVLSWGFVCYKFWIWFILPIFPTLPHLTFWQAVGLMFFITLFRNHKNPAKSDDTLEAGKVVGMMVVPWILLLIASFFVK